MRASKADILKAMLLRFNPAMFGAIESIGIPQPPLSILIVIKENTERTIIECIVSECCNIREECRLVRFLVKAENIEFSC